MPGKDKTEGKMGKELDKGGGIAADITERKRAEEGQRKALAEALQATHALRESEERFRSLFEGVPVGLYRTTPGGQIVDANPALVHMLGYPNREALLTINAAELYVDAEERRRWQALMERKGVVRNLEVQLRRRDGTIIWVEDNARAIRDADGRVLYYEGSLDDITEHKRMEEQAGETEELYRSMVELSPDSILTVDTKGMITSCNTAATRMLGYSRDEMVGKHFSKLGALRLRDLPKHQKLFRSALKGKVTEPLELTFLRKDGTPLLSNVRINLLKVGGKTILQSTARDITERKRAEEKLRSSEERLKILFEFAPDAIYLNDLKGTFIDGNKAAEELTGYKREELIGKSFLELKLLPPSQIPKAAALLARNVLGQPTGPDEFTLKRKDGSQVPVEMMTFPVKVKGQILVLGIARDISERKRAEEVLRESEEKYRHLVERANDGILIIQDRVIKYANPRSTEMGGYSVEEMIGTPFTDHVHPDEVAKTVDRYKRRMSGEDVEPIYETVLKRRDGSDLNVELNAGIITYQGKPADLVFVRDITERKRVEEALQKLTHDLGERVKELNCLYGISELVEKPDISLEELIQGTVDLIPPAWRYPEITCPRIILEGEEFTTEDFRETTCKQSSDIVLHGERIGTVEVYYLEERPQTDEGPFLKEERNLLNVIAERLGETIERMRSQEALKEYSERLEDMVKERTRELREAQAQLLAQQRLQQEVELAAQVQTSLLPRGVPSLEGFDFAATALPARYVSGDMYDFTRCGPETCHIVLADIAGKGIPAALLTSTARALMRAETEHEDSPATILSSVNTALYEDLAHAEVFITFLAARLDVRLGTLTYANAGHTETLWWQQANRTCRTLPATGLPLGIDADAPILEETLTLRPGDVLVFYSDGITEAANPHDELFGLDRLIAILSEHAHLPASELTQAIVEAVETFRAGAPLSDDLTLIVLKVLPRTISFTYPATLGHLNEVTALVQQVASAYGNDFAYQMELAASEIVTNVIQHAYRTSSGEMRGQITLLPDQIQLDLYDDGAPFDPSQAPPPALTELPDRGRGLFVARQLADELIYNPATPEGNHWRLIKRAEGA